MTELPTESELLQAIDNAGWLLEHHAVRTLAEADTHPRAGWAFQDPDEPTVSRELDVWSYRQMLADDANKVYVTVRFLVECKQSSNPYVGVGYDLPDARFTTTNPTQHLLPLASVKEPLDATGSYRMIPAWPHFGFDELARRHGESNFRVTQLTRLDRAKGGMWTANNSGIFTSLIYPLAKALRAAQKNRGAQPAGVGGAANRVGWCDFGLCFPVVLLSCPLYVVNATGAEPAIERRSWVTATRELKSEKVEGTFDIDIVTQEAFADYIADRLSFATAFADMIKDDPLKFTGEDHPPKA